MKNAEVERMGRSRQHEYVPPGMGKQNWIPSQGFWLGRRRIDDDRLSELGDTAGRAISGKVEKKMKS